LLAQVEGDAADYRSFAEILVALGPDEGRKAELAAVMEKLLRADPEEPLALYVVGLNARESGDPRRAAELWKRLLARLPADAPVRPAVESLIAEAERAGQTAPN
jgi:cytochrome c-type biogenesis protein CcmH